MRNVGKYGIRAAEIDGYGRRLREAEGSLGTVENYLRHAQAALLPDQMLPESGQIL